MTDYNDMTYEQAEDVLNNPLHIDVEDEMGGHAVYLASVALEKQIPQKMTEPADDRSLAEGGWLKCPVCGYPLNPTYSEHYCTSCGQALDWSEVLAQLYGEVDE